MTYPFKKESAPDFSQPKTQQAFVNQIVGQSDLLSKELDVNQAERALLKQRIDMMKSFLNELPSSDPQYGMLLTQIQMDQIEIDELRNRAESLSKEIAKKKEIS